MKNEDSATNTLEGVTLVPKPSRRLLNERQLIDYRSERERCIDWLLNFGKDPDRADGYAKTSVERHEEAPRPRQPESVRERLDYDEPDSDKNSEGNTTSIPALQEQTFY